MKLRSFTPLLLATAFAASLAHAETPLSPQPYSKSYTVCMDKASSTMSMVECIGTEHQAQDARLNAAYKALMQQLPTARQEQLRGVQRVWMSYRDANCQFYRDPDGGTLATLTSNQCMLEMTARRAAELEAIGKQP